MSALNSVFKTKKHEIKVAGTVGAAKIRVITKRSFMQRLTQPERTAIRKSTDDIVIDIHEDLKMASNVDLDLQDTIDAVAYLGSQGLLTTSDVDLLRDGDTQEEYVE